MAIAHKFLIRLLCFLKMKALREGEVRAAKLIFLKTLKES